MSKKTVGAYRETPLFRKRSCLSCDEEYMAKDKVVDDELFIHCFCKECIKSGIEIDNVSEDSQDTWLKEYGPLSEDLKLEK